jgi:hypothetical protein
MNSFSNDFSGIALSSIKILTAIVITTLVIILAWYIQKHSKKTPVPQKPPEKKEQGSEEKKEEKKETAPAEVKKIEITSGVKALLVFIGLILLYWYMKPERNPTYKQIVREKTFLNKGEEIVIRVAHGDSVYLSTPLPHLTVWQGSSEHVGTSKHYCDDERIVLSRSSRIIKITPCHGYYDTLTYTIYKQ